MLVRLLPLLSIRVLRIALPLHNMPSSSSVPFQAQPTNNRSYAQATKITPLFDFKYPSAEQGIIFPYVPDSKIYDYLVAINSILNNPKQIVAASRISNLRIAIFVSEDDLVDTIIDSPHGLIIAGKEIRGRRMKNKPSKLILSNVSPTIPNSIVEKFLTTQLNLKLASKISILRVNPQDNLFGHVISYRRQVYVNDLDLRNLPSSFLLEDNGSQHRIFLTGDDSSCFKCHSRLHKAENCPSNEPVSPNPVLSDTDFTETEQEASVPVTSLTEFAELPFQPEIHESPVHFTTDSTAIQSETEESPVHLTTDSTGTPLNPSFQLKIEEARRIRDSKSPPKNSPIHSNSDLSTSTLNSNPPHLSSATSTNTILDCANPQATLNNAIDLVPMDIDLSLKRSLRSNSTSVNSDISPNLSSKPVKKKSKNSQTLSQKPNPVTIDNLAPLISSLVQENTADCPPDMSPQDCLEFVQELLQSNTEKSFSNLSSYTEYPDQFLSFLSILHQKVDHHQLKNRITRLLNLSRKSSSPPASDLEPQQQVKQV